MQSRLNNWKKKWFN